MVICSYIPIFVGDFPSRFPHPAPWIMGKPRQQAHAFEAVEAASEFSWSISGGGFRGSPGDSLIFSGERMGQSQTQLYKFYVFSWHVPPGWSPFCYSWNPLMSWMFDGFSCLYGGKKQGWTQPNEWLNPLLHKYGKDEDQILTQGTWRCPVSNEKMQMPLPNGKRQQEEQQLNNRKFL